MSAPNDGGPAFPFCEWNTNGDGDPIPTCNYGGMTLRDYFAAKAMQGMLASGESPKSIAATAGWAYAIADTMLAERAIQEESK